MVCPHCHQNAPINYRGVFAFCAACGKPRAPFSATALKLAGRPSKFGGRVSRAFGWVILIFGLLIAIGLMLFFQLLWPKEMVGYAFGLPVALFSLVTSGLLFFGGRKLGRSGALAERRARVEALYGLAVNRDGTLTARDAARALALDANDVEELLAELAQTEPEHVSLEVDADGNTFYLFTHRGTRPHPFGAKYRVETDGKVRVTDVLGVDEPSAREADRSRR